MPYYRSRKSKSNVATIVAVILGLFLIASVTLGLGDHFGGWFDSSDDTEVTESTDELDSSSESTSEIEVSE